MTTVASDTPDPSRSYRQRIDDVIAALGTNVQRGLSANEAQSRLQQHGRNELVAEKPLPAWRRFLAQFQDVLVILLLVATRRNPALRAFYRRLLDAGKPKKVALIACMRKLLTILNAMMRTSTMWREIAQPENVAIVPSETATMAASRLAGGRRLETPPPTARRRPGAAGCRSR